MMAAPFLNTIAEGADATLAGLPGSGLAWLDAARRAQLDALLRDGLPDTHNEAWKYTALRALERHGFVQGDSGAAMRPVNNDILALPGVDGPRVVFVNGVYRPDLSHCDGLPEGLHIEPLSRVLADNPEPLRFFLTRDWERLSDAFARLNAAFASDGVVLRVAAGARIAAPVHIVHVGAPADSALAWHARNVVDVGEGASVQLVEHYTFSGDNAHLGTLVSDVVVREKATMDWVMLQDASTRTTLIRHHALHQDAHSTVRIHALERGGKLARNDIEADLRGDGAELMTRGVFLPHARQHLDTHLDIHHIALNTRSDSLWRGVADAGGRGVFHGQIIVEPGADGSDGALYNKNLLLSPNAEIDTQPVLEIYADEVMAEHGATVGQLDERALFYLRSRGIPTSVARSLLTVAFCHVALDALENAALREHLKTLLVSVLPVKGEDS